ncbi:hypothetical protein C8D77_111123 [Mesorhizobium loti]|uniref:Uncharacterized protein n=1 Tax=Rhizobium loti TaxID=381 RepID=A0A8E2WBA8_RHILI|nr:hypothetical protein [Mesorhizobium loti]PWJ88400.1 hypothetical protein C8D77_111123 [Mesorhizobium loti]
MTTADDDKFPLTAEEAESLLAEGEYVHNFMQAGFAILGCDYGRAEAIAAFKAAKSIEIGGDGCKGMKHPIVVFGPDGRHSFFAADMAKVEALEASRAASVPA